MKKRKVPALLLIVMQLFFNISVSVTTAATEGYYEWTFDEGTYTTGGETVSDTSGTNSATLATKTAPTFADGLITLKNASYYRLEKAITLAQDKKWRVEWKGKTEGKATKSECHTIFGNFGANQYIMQSPKKVFFGNGSSARVEFSCPQQAMGYKETSYILEGDGNRHVRLTYQFSGDENIVVSDWMDYPEAVTDLKFSTMFVSKATSSGTTFLYSGYMDYIRVWEEYEEKFTYSASNNKATVTGCNSEPQGKLVIPEVLGGFPVKAVGANAFAGYSLITEVTLPDSIESVGAGAFSGCSALETITIPVSVTAIGDGILAQSENAILKVYDGSFAHSYAVENSIPFILIEEPNLGIVENLWVVDSDGNRVYGTKRDMDKTDFYLAGTIQNSAKIRNNVLLCAMAMYDESDVLVKTDIEKITIPAQTTHTMTDEMHISMPVKNGMKLSVFLFTEQLHPVAKKQEISFNETFSGSIKMLAIGNSYAIDASTLVDNIAAADGVVIDVLALHIGGCSLETHWANAQSGIAAYACILNGNNTEEKISIPDALTREKWDYVSFQQNGGNSNDFSTFWTEENPYLTNLSELVTELAPQATQLIHETWALKNDRVISRYGDLYANAEIPRNAMFEDVRKTYIQAADMLGVNILPSGEAVHKALNDYGFTEEYMYRDNDSHLTKHMGRYLTAAVWYSSLTGNSIMTNPYTRSDITAAELQRLKNAANDAVHMEEYLWD